MWKCKKKIEKKFCKFRQKVIRYKKKRKCENHIFVPNIGMQSFPKISPSVKFPNFEMYSVFPAFPVFLGKEENLEKKLLDKNGPKGYCRSCRLRIFGIVLFRYCTTVLLCTGEDGSILRFMDSVAGHRDRSCADKLGGGREKTKYRERPNATTTVTANMLG